MGSEILGPLAFAKRGSSLLPFSVSSSQPGTLAQCHERKDTLNPQDIFLTEIGNEKELLLGMPKNTGYLNTPSYGRGRMGNVRL